MNAPDSAALLRPDITPPARQSVETLLAWPMIRDLVAFDTTSRDSNLALLDFVRRGKGVAGIHAACDSYHRNSAQPANAPPTNWAVLGIASLGSSTVRGYQTLGRNYNAQRQGF